MVHNRLRRPRRRAQVIQKQNDEEALFSFQYSKLIAFHRVRAENERCERDALVAATSILIFTAFQVGIAMLFGQYMLYAYI